MVTVPVTGGASKTSSIGTEVPGSRVGRAHVNWLSSGSAQSHGAEGISSAVADRGNCITTVMSSAALVPRFLTFTIREIRSPGRLSILPPDETVKSATGKSTSVSADAELFSGFGSNVEPTMPASNSRIWGGEFASTDIASRARAPAAQLLLVQVARLPSTPHDQPAAWALKPPTTSKVAPGGRG